MIYPSGRAESTPQSFYVLQAAAPIADRCLRVSILSQQERQIAESVRKMVDAAWAAAAKEVRGQSTLLRHARLLSFFPIRRRT